MIWISKCAFFVSEQSSWMLFFAFNLTHFMKLYLIIIIFQRKCNHGANKKLKKQLYWNKMTKILSSHFSLKLESKSKTTVKVQINLMIFKLFLKCFPLTNNKKRHRNCVFISKAQLPNWIEFKDIFDSTN